MRFSRYVDIIENGNETILCNTLTQEIVTVDSKKMKSKTEISSEISEDERKYLFENGFIHGDLESYKQKTINLKRDLVTITINITEDCNFSCTYCYQNDFLSKNVITDQTINNIMQYILDIAQLGVRRLYIYFFGGEPLLYKKRILAIKSKIDQIASEKSLSISYGLGTNAYLLTPDFVNHFDSLIVDTTLTSRKDHDRNRSLKSGSRTYDKIFENLAVASKSGRVKIHIGYNTSDKNTEEFQSFLVTIRQSDIKAHINCYYINNYEFNENYFNALSYEKYLKWVSSTAIDHLIENGFLVNISPFSSYRFECDAYNPWSVKFFSDGSIGLCNATNFYERRIIKSFTESSSFAEDVQYSLYDQKSVLPKSNNQCNLCELIAVCRGKVQCDTSCNPNYSIDRETFIRSFVKHTNLGNRKFFTQFN